MRSALLWETDLGLTTIGSGELSPGQSGYELRFKPPYGFGHDEWCFETGVLKGTNNVEMIRTLDFDKETKTFVLGIWFKESSEPTTIQIFARHYKTNVKYVIWEGEILPSVLTITNQSLGLTNNWNVLDTLKNKYPNINPVHSKVSCIEVKVEGTSVIVAKAGSIQEHIPENAPLILKGFHPEQEFKVLIEGYVIGYGGSGGDAGISTVTDDGVTISEPQDGLDGGNPIYVEYDTQMVTIDVARTGCFLAGAGGKGASPIVINDPDRRINQLGHPGVGGYPNGLTGSVSEIHYRLDLVKTNEHTRIVEFGKGGVNYAFEEAMYRGHDLPVFTSGKSTKPTKDGKSGNIKPKGVVKITDLRSQMHVRQLIYAFGRYVEM